MYVWRKDKVCRLLKTLLTAQTVTTGVVLNHKNRYVLKISSCLFEKELKNSTTTNKKWAQYVIKNTAGNKSSEWQSQTACPISDFLLLPFQMHHIQCDTIGKQSGCEDHGALLILRRMLGNPWIQTSIYLSRHWEEGEPAFHPHFCKPVLQVCDSTINQVSQKWWVRHLECFLKNRQWYIESRLFA